MSNNGIETVLFTFVRTQLGKFITQFYLRTSFIDHLCKTSSILCQR